MVKTITDNISTVTTSVQAVKVSHHATNNSLLNPLEVTSLINYVLFITMTITVRLNAFSSKECLPQNGGTLWLTQHPSDASGASISGLGIVLADALNNPLVTDAEQIITTILYATLMLVRILDA